ncbi:MAG: OmpA family protein [Methylobacter sp.]
MKTVKMNSKFFILCLIYAVLSGCATSPTPEFIKAQDLFNEVSSDPQVMAKAPIPLVEAEESLAALTHLLEKGRSEERINRLAYETQLKTRIAREKANTAIAKDIIAKAEAERQQVLLAARTSDAERLARQLAELQAQPTERGMVLTMGDVLFEYDKANVKAGGMRIVSKVAEFLRANPERNVQIEGHTDSVGSDAYNQRLSERRAEAVQQALMYQGIGQDRMAAIGYGKSFPIASNANSSGRQQNRRVEIVISDEKGNITKR